MAKLRSARRGKALAPESIEALEDLTGLSAALEAARHERHENELTRRPRGVDGHIAFTAQELAASYKPPLSREAARCYLDRKLKDGIYTRGHLRLLIGGQMRLVYVYWKKKK